MDRSKAIELSKIYSKVVKNVYNPYKVVLYGSSGDWLKTSGDLWRMTEEADTIIEPVLLDIQNDPSGFVQEVLRTGIEL